jgi:hypothetical protein
MKGSRTLIFNLVMGIGTIVGVETDPEMVQKALVWIAAVWTGGSVWLRAVTNTSMFRKD